MNNLKSYTEYAVSTPTTDFVIGFDFNYGTDAVNVTVDGVPATEAGYSVIYLNSTTMRLSPAVPSGVVRLQRETDIDVPDNQFTAGAKFIASNMDENFTQLRHAQQEVRDGFSKLSEDTYEIIDTLQDVGQAAQDAADAAEAAAQTANDAAAQVNDKVSYQDLDSAVEAAVTPVKDYIALPFNAGKSYALYERVQLANGNIVKSVTANNTNNPNSNMSGWVRTNDASQIFDGPLDQSTINYDLFNTPERHGADASVADNTAALQAWLDSAKVLHIRPFKVYKFSGTLTLTVSDQTIIGLTHQKYGNARLLYTGSGTAISAPTNVGYFSPKSWSLMCQVTEEGAAYKPGTVGMDIPSGTTIEAFDWSLMGFERLYSGAGTSYYNKFYFCRFSSFKEGFWNIASYNGNFVGCRWEKFTTAMRVLGGSGPFNIDHCSFERFNGPLVDSFSSKCLVNFTNNYVEIMDNEALPLHYTKANNQTKGRYWGGNVLFSGLFASLNINKNQLSMAGVFRVGSFGECDALDCSGNIVSLYIAGNNLDRLFHNVGQYTSFNVNDVIYGHLGPTGGYSRTYTRSAVILKSVRNNYFYYDCILDKVQPLIGRLVIINPSNGWTVSGANEPNVGAIALEDGSTFLGGALYGTIKTSNVALTVPVSHRPIKLGLTQDSCVLRAINIVDGTNVLFKYTYSNGELELMVTTPPATLGNVLLNVVIPPSR